MRRAMGVIVSVTIGSAVAVRAAGMLTLDAAMDRARHANAELNAASAEVEAARGRLAQASVLAANPILTTGANRHSIPGEVNTDSHVSLGQEIMVGGQRGLRMTAARFDVEHAESSRADRQRLVEGEVRRAFAGLVAAQRRRAVAVEGATQANRIVDVSAARLAQGDVGRVDVDLVRLDRTKANVDAISAANEVDRATARLAAAIGADPDEPVLVGALPDLLHEPPPESAAVAQALALRPDLAAARATRARLQGEADLTRRTGNVPNPTVRGYYSHENGTENLVGAEIEVPLPIFDRQRGAEADLVGQAAVAAAEVTRLERLIPREVQVALARYRNASASWGRMRSEALPAVDVVRAQLERSVASGLIGVTDLLVQEARLRDTRRAAVDAWLDLREAEADVIEAIGATPW